MTAVQRDSTTRDDAMQMRMKPSAPTALTLSAEDTRVQVFYPFHPLRNVVLQAVRRPKRGDGAVVVVDPVGRRR